MVLISQNAFLNWDSSCLPQSSRYLRLCPPYFEWYFWVGGSPKVFWRVLWVFGLVFWLVLPGPLSFCWELQFWVYRISQPSTNREGLHELYQGYFLSWVSSVTYHYDVSVFIIIARALNLIAASWSSSIGTRWPCSSRIYSTRLNLCWVSCVYSCLYFYSKLIYRGFTWHICWAADDWDHSLGLEAYHSFPMEFWLGCIWNSLIPLFHVFVLGIFRDRDLIDWCYCFYGAFSCLWQCCSISYFMLNCDMVSLMKMGFLPLLQPCQI